MSEVAPSPRVKLLLASSNPGKLREYAVLAAGHAVELELLPDFASLPQFDEAAPTLAENAAGKALHYSRFASLPVMADDSGLFVAALGGAPGTHSARYAGEEANDARRVQKLLEQMRGIPRGERGARFVCVVALAERARLIGAFSDFVVGEVLEVPRGRQGFGYDPIFFYPPLGKSFAEISREEKNQHSHRGKAFRKLLAFLEQD